MSLLAWDEEWPPHGPLDLTADGERHDTDDEDPLGALIHELDVGERLA